MSTSTINDGDSSGYWLDEKSEEFDSVKYHVLLASRLNNAKIRGLAIWKIDNPYLNVSFESRTQGMLTLDCWLNSKLLSEENPIVEVCRRGFLMPQETTGIKLQHGSINLKKDEDDYNNANRYNRLKSLKTTIETEDENHLYILSSVGVGRSYVVDAEELDKTPLPPSYDSYCISNNAIDTDGDGVVTFDEYDESIKNDAKDGYRYTYAVTEPSQILPKYVVRFTTNAAKDARQKEREAKLKRNHILDDKEDISEEYNSDNSDDSDDDEVDTNSKDIYDRYEFFDPILFTPVSLKDKMIGSHSSGEAANHKLISLEDAYAAAQFEASKLDPILEAKRGTISQQLYRLDDKLKEINVNYATVEQRLRQITEEALNTLRDLTSDKLKVLLSAELELRRELDQINWIEEYLLKKKEERNKLAFLRAWKAHTKLRSQICQQISLETAVVTSVQASLDLEGNLSVVEKFGAHKIDGRDSDQSNTSTITAQPKNQDYSWITNSSKETLLAHALATSSFSQPISSEKNTMSTTGSNIIEKTRTNLNENGGPAFLTNSDKETPFDTQGKRTKSQLPVPSSLANKLSVSGVPYPVSGGGTLSWSELQNSSRLNEDSLDLEWKNTLRQEMGLTPETFSEGQTMGNNNNSNISSKGNSTAEHGKRVVPKSNSFRDRKLVSELSYLSNKFQHYSLRNLATRKRKQLNLDILPANMFPNSVILNRAESETLYYSLPFTISAPTTSLVYSTYHHERSLFNLQQVANDILGPSVVIVRSGEYIFGGYASDPWRFDEVRFGNPKCFLFSITLDTKIPYHGRNKDSDQLSRPLGKELYQNKSHNRYDCLIGGESFMGFGIKDFMIRSDFRKCSSTLESSYGFGLSEEESKCFLAGSEVFTIDELEFWQIQ